MLFVLTLTHGEGIKMEIQQTSLEAYNSIRKGNNPLMQEIIYTLAEEAEWSYMGGDGLTCDELEQILDAKHQSVSAKIREGVLGNEIEDSGMRRKTRSGRNAIVWVLTRGPE